MKRTKLLAAIAALSCAVALPAVAETVSQETALAAAEGFLTRSSVAQRILAGRTVKDVEARGNLWIVNLEPSGYIEIAGSTKCAPIAFFSTHDFVEPDVDSPFAAKLTGDSMMVAEKEADEYAVDNADWAKYTATVSAKRRLLAAAPSGTTGVVGPLMNCGWGQGAPFNDLSPLSSLCGCMATAAGQEHRYWRWPYRYEKSRQGTHGLRNSLGEYSEHVMRPDGRVPFNYDKVVAYAPNPASSPWATDKEATYQTAWLSLWMQSLTGMSYKPGASGGTQKLCNFAEDYWFERGPVMSYWRDGYTNLWNAIKADLDFGSPIQVNSPGHQMVVDGYAIENEGEANEVDYININYGWGSPEGWVNLLTAVTESTSGGRLADFQIGYRPQKIVQFEPVPKVSTSNVTLTWHLPPCYTNRTTGFTIEIAKAGGATTSDTIATHEETTTYTANGLDNGGSYTFTVTPVMSDGSEARANSATTTIGTPKAAPEITGVSSVACGIDLVQQGFYIECGRGITNKIAVACSTSVTSLSAYSSHLTVLPDAKVAAVNNGNGSWTINVDATTMAKDWDGDMLILTLVAANDDGTEAYKNLMLRFNSMRQELGGTYDIVETAANNAVWFCGTTSLDAKGQNVTFGTGAFCGTGTITLADSVGGGSFTFQGLDNFTGTLKWAPSVTVNLPSDMSNFAGTLNFDSYASTYRLARSLGSKAKVYIGGTTQLYIDNNVTVDAAITGSGYIMVVGSAPIFGNLSGFTGHISLGDWDNSGTVTIPAGQEKGVVIDNGTVNLILSRAQVAYGYSTSAITMQGWGSVVFKDESGNTLKTWTSSQSTYAISSSANTWTPDELGTGNFWDAARWSHGLPSAGDYVIFNDNFGDTEMTLNLASDFNLGHVLVTGTKLTISADSGSATLSVDTFRNTAIAAIATLKCAPTTVVPEGKLRLQSGLGISCDVDSSLADNMKWYHNDTVPAMYFADIWKGTVVFSSYAAAGLDLGYWANTDSVVRLNGVTGYLKSNTVFPYAVELVDNGDSPALSWSDGSSGAQSTFDILTGTGTFKTSGSGGSTEKVLIKDISGFTGSFNLAAKNVAIADAMPDDATGNNGRLYVEKEVEISAGKGWAANGGLYLGTNANLTVSGAFATGSAINTYGEGAVLTLEDGASVKVNGAIAGDDAPTLNFKAGTFQITKNLTETKTVNFCAAAGKYTALDANGNTFTLGANFFSGAGDVYLKTSASGGSFVIQGIPAAYTGTIYVDNSIGLTISGDLSQMGGKINISDITLLRDSSNIGKIDVCSGATLQIVLTDREAMGGFTPSGVTLLGGTVEYVDLRGTIITTSTESVAYTKPDDYSVPAPEPTAVWVSGQFADEAELHGGYAISTMLAGDINASGNIVIGESAYLGAQISLPENTYTKASVLVKFKAPSGGAPAANSVIAGVFDTSEYPIGAICKTAGGTAFEGYYQAKNGTGLTTGYNLSSPTISEGEGYMLFSFQSDPTSIQPATGTALYLGNSIANLAGGAWAGLQWRGHTISKLAIGGPAVATPSPWKGLEIESVALFAGEWFSPSDIEFYEFPKAEEPEYEGPDPVAVWVAGEFDDDRSAHGGLEISLNGNTTNALGQIVIGGSTALGATIAISDGFDNATMLVKYEIPSGGAPVANASPSSMFVNYDLGACAGVGSSDLVGYFWNTTKNPAVIAPNYAFSSPAPSIPQEGYLLISAPANSGKNTGNHFVAVYVGETIANLSGGEAGSGSNGLRFTGPNNRVTSVGIGGPTVAGAKPWAGMVIKSVALFDEWVTTNVIANYKFPEHGAVLPEDSDRYAIEPVAKWVNDFKTTEKNGCTLSVSGTTAAKDDSFGGTLTIGDAAAVIDTTAAATSNMTVLIKYRAASNVVNAPVAAFGGYAKSGNNLIGLDVGVYTKSDKTLAVYRNYNADNGKPYDFDTSPVLSETGGYVLCARNNSKSCMVYVGDALDMMTGSVITNNNIQFSNIHLTSLGIGGSSSLPANANDMVPFTGLVVEKIAIFAGYYTPADLIVIENPEEADTLSIGAGKTWKFAAGETKTYTNIGTLNAGGTIAITNAATLAEGFYMLATWTKAQKMSAGYGYVGTLTTEGLPQGLSAELVYGAKAIYLRVWNAETQSAKGTLAIWPYGDSITEGFHSNSDNWANYRALLAQKLTMLGYNVKMVGCYDKIQSRSGTNSFHDTIDPSGRPVPDNWKSHSAKHGGTIGVVPAAPKRGAMVENVDTLCAQAGNPDVVLLHAGINDLSISYARDVDLVYADWTNVVWRIIKDLPNSKIVVSTTLNACTPYNSTLLDSLNKKSADFSNKVRAQVARTEGIDDGAFPAGRVFLADLNAAVTADEEDGYMSNDGLHPDWWGHDQMAEGWLEQVTNLYPNASAAFPSATPIVAPTSEQLGAAAKPELVDFRRGYKRYGIINATNGKDHTDITYSDVDEQAPTNDIARVGYFVEYVRADNNVSKWVWVDMEAFGSSIEELGLPSSKHQTVVNKLHVKSNHNGIDEVPADDDTVAGWIEFTPFKYSGTSSGDVTAPAAHGGGSYLDWNDTLNGNGETEGCMQVFRTTSVPSGRPAQVLFAYNNWNQNSTEAEFGIGNFSQHFWGGDATLDYTHTRGTEANAFTNLNASAYSVKRIEIWTKTAEEEGEKATTTTDYPMPFSWLEQYLPAISGQPDAMYENVAKSTGGNGYKYWESYVLGLDPTNETSKFTVSIRMDGTTPIVEYSPTNDTIAIQYILQGKPALTNDWFDCPSFDEPGDTNRFFRVKVNWEQP